MSEPGAIGSVRTIDDSRPASQSGVETGQLPVPLTSLIGRGRERAALTSLMLRDDVRLVTMTGPGGVGKTRLAIDVAASIAEQWRDGVRFVSLAPVPSPDLVLPAIGIALGLPDDGSKPIEDRLKRRIAHNRILLVLDNFEHVEAAAPQLASLLMACPGLSMLVTSRARLNLGGEHERVIPPLGLPDPSSHPSPDAIGATEAVALFVERARALQPDFHLDQANAALVAEICRRLDGLPLGIELAAARIKILSPDELLDRLDNRLALLTGGACGLPARQRTMRDAIAWSFGLLSPDEQVLFRRLAAFAGGCTLRAAEVVSGMGAVVPDLVMALIDKSLLQRAESSHGDVRFTMLETIRDYALEQLVESDDATAARAAHAAWCLSFAERVDLYLTGPDHIRWQDREASEMPNMRAALRWLADSGQDEQALRLATALARFWEVHGYWVEGERWLGALVRRTAGNAGMTGERATACAGLGTLAIRMRDFDRAVECFEQSLTLARAAGDRRAVAFALDNLGYLADDRGDRRRAEELLAEGLALYRKLGEKRGLAKALDTLGLIALLHEERDRAGALLEESLAHSRDLGDQWLMAMTLTNLGVLANHEREYARARARFEESLSLARIMGGNWLIPLNLSYLGLVAQVQGDASSASALFAESLTLCRDRAPGLPAPRCLEGLAAITAGRGDGARAARLFGAAQAMRTTIQGPMLAADRAIYEPIVADVRHGLGEEAFSSAWSAGQVLPLEMAIDEALMAAEAVTAPRADPLVAVKLTPREIDVLWLLVAGRSDHAIADALFISPRTVHHHVGRILAKFGVHSRAEATRLALADGRLANDGVGSTSAR